MSCRAPRAFDASSIFLLLLLRHRLRQFNSGTSNDPNGNRTSSSTRERASLRRMCSGLARSALVKSAEAEQDVRHAAHAKAIKYAHKIPAKIRAWKTIMLDRSHRILRHNVHANTVFLTCYMYNPNQNLQIPVRSS